VTSHALSLEFARLDDYLALMQIRMGQRLTYRLDLPEDLREIVCPALLLQPLVENAVLHGLEPNPQGGEIVVSACQTNQQLILTVADTGLGLQPTDSSMRLDSGFGLTQLRERLATLYGDRATVLLTAHTPKGTLVTLTLPLSKDHETNCCPYKA
jgi:sensor histidine kinase YesM